MDRFCISLVFEHLNFSEDLVCYIVSRAVRLKKKGFFLIQEVIKAISGKGEPLKNFFYFDAEDGKGVIEDISKP